MKDLIFRFLFPKNRFRSLSNKSYLQQDLLLFDESAAAQEIAFMLGGQWDGCNAIVMSKCDEVAINTAASLLGAKWCYSGATNALLVKLSADQLISRYGRGERNFINANLRCARLNSCLLSQANLSWAKLNKADLSEANLSSADLTAADLSEANLSQANLSQANLSRTNLTKANLAQADLRGVSLNQACLLDANLSGADLRGAKLSLADLRGTNLSGADLKDTQLTSADLTRAIISEETICDWMDNSES